MDKVFERSFASHRIEYDRYMTNPTIFNNILWQGVAEGDTAYYYGQYSLLDRVPEVREFISIPKNHHLLEPYEGARPVEILKWFSDGYYSVIELPDGKLQYNDLRFGSLTDSFDDPSDFVFRFLIEEQAGKVEVWQSRERPDDMEEAFKRLIERIEGI